MNMRRGLLRLWVLGTACWIMAGIYLHQNDLLVLTGYEFRFYDFGVLSDCLEEGRFLVGTWSSWFRQECYSPHPKPRAYLGLAWVLMPPVAVLILGSSIGWVLSGFRGEKQ